MYVLALTIIALLEAACPHEALHEDPQNDPVITVIDGTVYQHTLQSGAAQKYHYTFDRPQYINSAPTERPMIMRLSPCSGISYLLVRKTARCWPDPFSCCASGTKGPPCINAACPWTHYTGNLTGVQDGGSSVLEVSVTSRDYFITVYAEHVTPTMRAEYELLVLSDTTTFPRPGSSGAIKGVIDGYQDLVLQWKAAYYYPQGFSTSTEYEIYLQVIPASYQLPESFTENVFIGRDKILNTVCGIKKTMTKVNTGVSCSRGACTATVSDLDRTKVYAFNIVATSARGYSSAYAGIVVRDAGKFTDTITDNDIATLIGGTAGACILVILTAYAWVSRLYLFHTLDRDV